MRGEGHGQDRLKTQVTEIKQQKTKFSRMRNKHKEADNIKQWVFYQMKKDECTE